MPRKSNTIKHQDSPSEKAMERTYIRALQNGGVTQDFSANVENIREISRKLGYNILKTPVQRNLIQFSEQFDNPYWGKSNTTVTANSTISPFGTNSADKMVSSSGSSVVHYLTASVDVSSGSIYTLSIYAKASEYSGLTLVLTSVGFNTSIFGSFDLLTGTCSFSTPYVIASNVSVTAINVGDGWYRCSLSALATLTTSSAFQLRSQVTYVIGDVAYIGDGVSGIYLSGVQFEQGSIMTKYQPTENIPIDGDFTNANFLYVPSSYGEGKNFAQVHNYVNILQRTEEFENSYWAKGGVTIVANSTTSPNGSLTADSLMETANNVTHFINLTTPLTNFVVGLPYTVSIYIKANGRQWALVDLVNPSDKYAYFDIVNGVVGTVVGTATASIQDAGNGWWRCSITSTSTSINGGVTITPQISDNGPGTYLGDITKGIFIWGAQLEKSTVPTAYKKVITQTLGDGIVDFNFTRATASTVTNKQGVIEDSCYNLALWSEDFANASWLKTQATITTNVITAPNGTLTADKLIENTGNTAHLVYREQTGTNGVAYTFSCYMKAAEKTNASIYLTDNVAGNINTKINLTTGVFTVNYEGSESWQNKVGTVTDAGNGWWRVSISGERNASGTIVGSSIYVNDSTPYIGVNGSGIYIWGAQLVQGSTPRPYLRTTNRLNAPKLDYSRSLLEPSLLIEPQRTNLHLQSEDFTNVAWGKSAGSSMTLTAVVNNFGNSKSYIYNEGSFNNIHFITQGISTVNASIYTATMYLKKADVDWIQIAASPGFGNNLSWVNFNLTTGLFGNTGSFSMTYSATMNINGFWKIIITTTCTNTGTNGTIELAGTNDTDTLTKKPTYTGTNKNLYIISAMQFEVGSNATTYIPTTTATVTRNAETSYVDLFNNAALNSTNFTLFWEGYLYKEDFNTFAVFLSDSISTVTTASSSNQIGWFYFCSPFYTIAGAINYGSASPIGHHKFAIKYNNGIANYYIDGTLLWINRSIPVFNYKYLVVNGGGTYATDKIALFNRTLTDIEIISLTTL